MKKCKNCNNEYKITMNVDFNLIYCSKDCYDNYKMKIEQFHKSRNKIHDFKIVKINKVKVKINRNQDLGKRNKHNMSNGRIKRKTFLNENLLKVYKAELIKKYGNKCMCCKANEKIELDHIYPVSVFPNKANDLNNLQLFCKECNKNKGNRYIINFKELTVNEKNVKVKSDREI